MYVDIEETLVRELGEVAEALQVPVMPPLPLAPPRVRRGRQPLLVAAAVVLVVAGAVAVLQNVRGGREVDPAPPSPSPSPSRTAAVVRIPTTAPTVPYVLGQELYVDGEQVPGTWWSVRAGGAGWLALQSDGTWWWGRGPDPHRIEAQVDNTAVISPNGKYVAEVVVENGKGLLTGFDTAPSGEGLGGLPVDLDAPDGTPIFVRAVTDDGRVIVQGTGTSLLWLPLVDGGTVDLSETAPDQQVLGSTPAGLVVTDGEGGEPYLAEISDAGELTRIGTVPSHDDLVVSPGGEWLAWTPVGTLGGEVTAIGTLEARSVDGFEESTLTAPSGWGFAVMRWEWEDDDHLVSPVVRDGDGGERMARCSVAAARCVLIKTD